MFSLQVTWPSNASHRSSQRCGDGGERVRASHLTPRLVFTKKESSRDTPCRLTRRKILRNIELAAKRRNQAVERRKHPDEVRKRRIEALGSVIDLHDKIKQILDRFEWPAGSATRHVQVLRDYQRLSQYYEKLRRKEERLREQIPRAEQTAATVLRHSNVNVTTRVLGKERKLRRDDGDGKI